MRAVCGYCDKDVTEKGQCDCADSLKDQMALLKRLLREYRQDHNDREDDALDGAQNNGCCCGLCDQTEEVLK